MKRALALLEQSKNTMPHLPRPSSKEQSSTDISTTQANFEVLGQSTKSTRSGRLPSASKIPNEVNKSILPNSIVTGPSSRKSTAVSQSTRNEMSTGDSLKKKNSFTKSSAMDTDLFLQSLEKPNGLDLSLKASKKPPQRLKPLKETANVITSLLEIKPAYQKDMIADIDNDLKDYLNTDNILSQMQSAFGTSSSVFTEKKKPQTAIRDLDPILEEGKGALVEYKPNATLAEQRARKNEALKNKVKKLTGGQNAALPIENGKNFEKVADDKDTFITSTKIKEQPMSAEDQAILKQYDEIMAQRKPKKFYKYEEDELLDECDQHEQDMNEMLKYLSEVEELIRGNDLKSIQQMMDVTKETMGQHFQAYDRFKSQINEIDTKADEAIKILSFYDTDDSSKNNKKKTGMQLARVNEDPDEHSRPIGKASQEESKSKIVSTLLNMNQNMREFTSEIEQRLDKAYRSGATSKFGYDSITNLSKEPATDDKVQRHDEKILSKMQKQAQQFIDQNSAASMLKSAGSMRSSAGHPRSSSSSNKVTAMKALPPSSGLPAKRQNSMIRTGGMKRGINDDISRI